MRWQELSKQQGEDREEKQEQEGEQFRLKQDLQWEERHLEVEGANKTTSVQTRNCHSVGDKKYQKSTELLICQLPFECLV